jgi:ketosteroid isomerase-like protein
VHRPDEIVTTTLESFVWASASSKEDLLHRNFAKIYAVYGNNILLHSADALVVHRSQDPRVVILEYEVHGKIIRTGASYDNRFISVVTIGDREIVHWRDYMDSLTAMTALSQRQQQWYLHRLKGGC